MEEWGERKSKSLCRRRENKEKNQNKKRDGELGGEKCLVLVLLFLLIPQNLGLWGDFFSK